MRLAAAQREMPPLFILADEGVAELVFEKRRALVELERRLRHVRAGRDEAEAFEQAARRGVDGAELHVHLCDVVLEVREAVAVFGELPLERPLLLVVEREVFLVVSKRGFDVREVALPDIALRFGIGLQAVVENLTLYRFHARDDALDRRFRLAELAREAAELLTEGGGVFVFVGLRFLKMLLLAEEARAQRRAVCFFLREEVMERGAVFRELRAERLRRCVFIERGERGRGRGAGLFRFCGVLAQARADEALQPRVARAEARLRFRDCGLCRFIRVFARGDGRLGVGDVAGFERLADIALLCQHVRFLLRELARRQAACGEHVCHFLIQRLELAVHSAELVFKVVRRLLHGGVCFHAFDNAAHFLDALLQHALLAEMVALLFEELGEAVAAFARCAVFVRDAFLDRRDQQAVDERLVRAAVFEERFDAAFRLVDGGNLVPLRRDDAELFFDVGAVRLDRVVFRKKFRRHVVVGDAAEQRREFFFRCRARLAVVLADEWQALDAVAVVRPVFVGKFL